MKATKLITTALSLLVAGAGLFVATHDARRGADAEGQARAAAPMPPMPAPVATVVKKTIPVALDYAARTESMQNVALQVRV